MLDCMSGTLKYERRQKPEKLHKIGGGPKGLPESFSESIRNAEDQRQESSFLWKTNRFSKSTALFPTLLSASHREWSVKFSDVMRKARKKTEAFST